MAAGSKRPTGRASRETATARLASVRCAMMAPGIALSRASGRIDSVLDISYLRAPRVVAGRRSLTHEVWAVWRLDSGAARTRRCRAAPRN